MAPITQGVPNEHIFMSHDVSDYENITLAEVPGVEVDYNPGQDIEAIVYSYTSSHSGTLGLYIADVTFVEVEGIFDLVDSGNSNVIVPYSAVFDGDTLFVTAYDGTYGYLISLDLSIASSPSINYVKKTDIILLDACILDATALAIIANNPSTGSGSGFTVIIVDKSDGTVLKSFSMTAIEAGKPSRAQAHCDSNSLYVIVRHDLSSFSITYIDLSVLDYNSFLYGNDLDFSPQDVVASIDGSFLYAVGGGRGSGFNADDYMDPTILTISLDALRFGDEPVLQAVIMHSSQTQDYFFYGADVHEDASDPWLGLVGAFEFTSNTYEHGFFALYNTSSGALGNIIVAPASIVANNDYTRGLYRDLVETNGYVWAYGMTKFAQPTTERDPINLATIFLSQSIDDTLTWDNTPAGEDWPPFTTSRPAPVYETITKVSSISQYLGIDPVYVTVTFQDDTNAWSVKDISDNANKYPAFDNNTPVPIPEPLILVLVVLATVAFIVAYNYYRRL